MEEKLRFVFEYERRERSMKELCERYEIARETGYVCLRRYQDLGDCLRPQTSYKSAWNLLSPIVPTQRVALRSSRPRM